MIHVERTEPPPEELQSLRSQIMEEASGFYSLHPDDRAQRKFKFSEYRRLLKSIVITPLLELFHGKCAFCETQIETESDVDLERFRPETGAINSDGSRSSDHYWWLAADWRNLYPACPLCNRAKGSRFPVKDDQRSPLGAEWGELAKEPALLLDPCVDTPEDHLVFWSDGTVAAVHLDDLPEEEKTRFGTPTRGQVTIDTFGLNRTDLIEARRREAASLMIAFEDVDSQPERLSKHLDPASPYLQMKRQVVRFSESSGFIDSAVDLYPPTVEMATPEQVEGLKAKYERAFDQQTRYEEQIKQASVESEADSWEYQSRASYIERVEIHGFTSMSDFDFTFGSSTARTDGSASWLMLLGENGVGKTSVLKAIALAMAGPRRLEELQDEVSMQGLPSLFQKDGFVRVFLTSQSEPLEIHRDGDLLVCRGDSSGAKAFVRAFGPSRWFPTPNSSSPESDSFVRIENLFNPFVPLELAETYLANLEEPRWDQVALGLKELLQVSDEGYLSNADGKITFRLPGDEPKPLRALSAGFEAVIAMTADLIHLLFQRWSSLTDAEGIVLLDEIGAHLHPRWKMRIVESLRRTFPRVQFLATTHEPLCLRGLHSGEILVMQRSASDNDSESEVVATRPEQDVSQLRIDQLLTSRLFGLHSTLDPDLEERFDRYYELLSKHETAITEEEQSELALLRKEVGGRGILGDTRRDQMIYRIIDEFVAREFDYPSETERSEAEQKAMKDVAEFWSRIPDVTGEGR